MGQPKMCRQIGVRGADRMGGARRDEEYRYGWIVRDR